MRGRFLCQITGNSPVMPRCVPAGGVRGFTLTGALSLCGSYLRFGKCYSFSQWYSFRLLVNGNIIAIYEL